MYAHEIIAISKYMELFVAHLINCCFKGECILHMGPTLTGMNQSVPQDLLYFKTEDLIQNNVQLYQSI